MIVNKIDAVQVLLHARALRIPVAPAIGRVKYLTSGADPPAALVAYAEVEQLRVRAAVLLAPARAAIVRHQDQPAVADDVARVLVHELHGVEVNDAAFALPFAVAQRKVAADEAAPGVRAAQDRALVADNRNAVAAHGHVVQAYVNRRRDRVERAAFIRRARDQAF